MTEDQDLIFCNVNPVNNAIQIQFVGAFQYQIFDVLGNQILQGNGENFKTIENQISSGIYVVEIKTSTKNQTFKILK